MAAGSSQRPESTPRGFVHFRYHRRASAPSIQSFRNDVLHHEHTSTSSGKPVCEEVCCSPRPQISYSDVCGRLLDDARSEVKQSVLSDLEHCRYAIVTDGCSKRAAQRGTPLINCIVCPDDGPAVFWRVHNAAGWIKDANYVYALHQCLRKEVKDALPNATLCGYVMDSTATNRKALKMLEENDNSICAFPCASHALSLVIKHAAKFFEWIENVYDVCCPLSEKLINNEKLRSELHSIQTAEYGRIEGICAHVPTRFGGKHCVLRDVVGSEEAIIKLSTTQA